MGVYRGSFPMGHTRRASAPPCRAFAHRGRVFTLLLPPAAPAAADPGAKFRRAPARAVDVVLDGCHVLTLGTTVTVQGLQDKPAAADRHAGPW
jgi:hypothetical protein